VFVMFIELRWSMIALAAPSRSVETVNASSFTTEPSAAAACRVLTRLKSRTTVAPGPTFTVAVAVR